MLHSCLLVYFGSYEDQLKEWLTSPGPFIATPIGPASATPTHPALATPQRVITPSGKLEEAVDGAYYSISKELDILSNEISAARYVKSDRIVHQRFKDISPIIAGGKWHPTYLHSGSLHSGGLHSGSLLVLKTLSFFFLFFFFKHH